VAGVDADRDGAVLGDGDLQSVSAARRHVDIILGKFEV